MSWRFRILRNGRGRSYEAGAAVVIGFGFVARRNDGLAGFLDTLRTQNRPRFAVYSGAKTCKGNSINKT